MQIKEQKGELKTEDGVDKSLVAMFLRMTPEQRIQANDNAARLILELRDAYQRQTRHKSGAE